MLKHKLILLTPLFCFLTWPPIGFTPLIFCAFVSMFYTLDKFDGNLLRAFLVIYLSIFIWNLSITYWIFYTSLSGGLFVHLLNPLILSLPFIVYRLIHKQNQIVRYGLFTLTWLSIEYLHFNWQLGFPFLTLGYALSSHSFLFQFYEYTGVLGGSLWILITNILIYNYIIKANDFSKTVRISVVSSSLLIPLCMSIVLVARSNSGGHSLKYVSLQTSVDCRNEKYTTPTADLVRKYIEYSKPALDDSTDLLVWPETAITNLETLDIIDQNNISDIIYSELLGDYPNLKLVSGAIVYDMIYGKNKSELNKMPNARYSAQGGFWYKTYNAAVQFDFNDLTQFRTKEKLVPVEETIPFSSNFNFLRSFVSSLGGFSFSYLPSDHIFQIKEYQYTPLICYESIFGEYIANRVLSGAEFFVVISNEGWFKNKRGAAQFIYYAATKAVETRRDIIKSSNLGVSAHINKVGNIVKSVDEFEYATISGNLILNDKKTFYTKHGDFIGRISILLLAVSIIFQSISRCYNFIKHR